MPLVAADERRDIQRLSSYPEDTAGAEMTTEFARLSEELTVEQALREISRQAEDLETIYYLYAADDEDHLRGIVSARQLVSAIGKADVQAKRTMGMRAAQLADVMLEDTGPAGGGSEAEEGTSRYFYADYGPGTPIGFYDNVTGNGPCNQEGGCNGTDES